MSKLDRFYLISTQITEDEMSLTLYSKAYLNQLNYIDQTICLNKKKNTFTINSDIFCHDNFSTLFSKEIYDLNNNEDYQALINMINQTKRNENLPTNLIYINNDHVSFNIPNCIEFVFYYPKDYGKDLMIQYFEYIESFLKKKINNNS